MIHKNITKTNAHFSDSKRMGEIIYEYAKQCRRKDTSLSKTTSDFKSISEKPIYSNIAAHTFVSTELEEDAIAATPPYILLHGFTHVVIVACNYPLSAYMNCNLW